MVCEPFFHKMQQSVNKEGEHVSNNPKQPQLSWAAICKAASFSKRYAFEIPFSRQPYPRSMPYRHKANGSRFR
jgi:hypothetical protein